MWYTNLTFIVNDIIIVTIIIIITIIVTIIIITIIITTIIIHEPVDSAVWARTTAIVGKLDIILLVFILLAFFRIRN